MEQFIIDFVAKQHLLVLFLIGGACIFALVKGADLLVEEAVALSLHWGVPKMVVGATVVSLGTTLPDAAVSVLAAITGNPGLALGNAVGSIICDTGLILGVAALIAPLPLVKSIINRHGWVQLGAGFLLVIACLPFSSLANVFTDGGRMPQWMGWVFVVLLVLYIWTSIKWVKKGGPGDEAGLEFDVHGDTSSNTLWVFAKMIFGIAVVIVSSHILIPVVTEIANRFEIPEAVIAATLVAFGTSLPELVTAVTASLKKHGELALGNVIGADILNVFFVAGTAAAVTPGGLEAPASFFKMLFPAMILILIVFRVGTLVSGPTMKRGFGVVLILSYLAITIVSLSLGHSTGH
ncbi:MAG: sodium:calcium antiporter [Verrucomicrobiota bacterium]